MKTLFHWLELHPNTYWVGVVLASGALLAAVFQPLRRPENAPRRDWIFALLLLLFLLAWRWPALFWPQGLNPDESQLVSGAITLTQDPVFWRSVDGNTAGPFNFYVLLPLHWLGLPLDYLSARLTGLLLVWGALFCCYRMLRPSLGAATARVGLLPGALFFATVYNGDFIHYSTEHLPLFLFSATAWLLWGARDGSRQAKPGLQPAWLAAGVCMGLLPWSKLQAAPLAAALALWGVILALGDRQRAWPARCARIGWLATAALTPTFAILVMVRATGQWEHFFKTYIVNNLAYVGKGGNLVGATRELLDRMQGTWSFPALALTSVAIVLAAAFHGLARRQRPSHLFVAGGCFTVVATLCVLIPQRGFLHYLLFLVPPLTWWGAAALGEFRPKASGRATPALVFLVASLALAAIPVGMRLRGPRLEFLTYLTDRWTRPYDELGFLLGKLRKPGDTLAVWGWYSHLHVESRLAQATREAVSERQIQESWQRDTYYRPRYLADLQRNQPAFFVDAVGPRAFAFTGRDADAHENFPALAAYVAEHYRLIDDAGHSRLYVRGSRLDELGFGGEDLRRLVASARQYEDEMLSGKVPASAYLSEVARREVLMLLPPAEISWQLSGTERSAVVQYGFHPQAAKEATDGAEFIVELRPPGQPARPLFHRFLDPPRRTADRGFQYAEIVLPPYPPGTALAVRTTNGQHDTDAWDWVFLYQLRFRRAAAYLPAQFPGFSRVPDEADAPHSYLLETDQGPQLMLDSPAALNYALRGTESRLEFDYGFQEGAYRDGGQTDGATFIVEIYPPDQPSRVLFAHHLDPRNNPTDQGRQHAKVTLPPAPPGCRLMLRIDPGPQGNNSWDWTYITNFQLQ